jgi:hypothetical protein
MRANKEQLEILKQGVEVWNSWRKENPEVKINLKDAKLSGYNLDGANLVEADLVTANLGGASLQSASLLGAHLRRAFLDEVDLSNTELSAADLSGAVVRKSNFSKAIMSLTILGDMDLSEVSGLETVIHFGPSTIGVDTIAQSKGKIPEVFLRGCGLNNLQIETAKLAVPGLDPEQITDITYKIHQLYLGGGIQYYSCFISYSSKDYEIVQQLHNDLQNNGVRCWFDREDLKIGDAIRPTIDRQIRLRDKLLVILSENSVKSEWVGDEVEGALEEESKSNRLVLFPIRLDDTVLNTRDDWAAKIKRRRHIGDFSNWKDKASYQKAFERLLRDLKATGGQVNGE